jgi:predicted amidohydrolase
MGRTVSIAAVNFITRAVGSFDDFAAQVRRTLDRCRAADIVVLPEYFGVGLFSLVEDWRGAPLEDLRSLARFEGEIAELLAGEAARRGQHILGGTTLASSDEGCQNVSVLYAPDGARHRHSKSHLMPEERMFVDVEGDKMDVIDLGQVRVGIAICYEIEFPECVATLAELGAEVILCPSLTLSEAGFWRVRHCAAARAIENQVYVVHSCAGGVPDHALPGGWAQASILSPCDRAWEPTGVLGETAANVEDVIVRTVDLDELHAMREGGDATTFRDRRRRADVVREWPSHLRQLREAEPRHG